MSDEAEAEARVGAELAAAGQTPHEVVPGRLVGVVIPADWEWSQLDIERYQPNPVAKIGSALFSTAASLARYVNAHKITGTELFANPDTCVIQAVIDGHASNTEGDTGVVGAAGWGRHRATLQARKSPEWNYWVKDIGWVDQERFALHIEGGLPDILRPDAATVLEMAQSFIANRTVDYESARRIDNGLVQLVYKETIAASAGQAGQIEIPQEIVLSLRPFLGSASIEVPARLRYRVKGTSLELTYQVVNADRILEEAFDSIIADVEAETGINPYLGAARS